MTVAFVSSPTRDNTDMGEDVYDVARAIWCNLCQAQHLPCEVDDWGVDIGPWPDEDEDDLPS